MTKKLLLPFLFAPSLAFAQPVPGYPRTVIHCELDEGGVELSEDLPGIYSYVGSQGALGSTSGGQVKIAFDKEADKCILKISATGKTKPFEKSLSWKVNPEGVPKEIQQNPKQDGDCKMKARYSKSLGQCSLPTATEPGDQCHGEGAKDVTGLLPSSNPQVKRKLSGHPGGMVLETDEGSEKGIAVWRHPKDKKTWCYQSNSLFAVSCTPLSERLEVKNKAGEVIGVLEPKGDQVSFKQTKAPYSASGYQMDDNAPTAVLLNTSDETNLIALGKNGAELGRFKISGPIALPERLRSFNRRPTEWLSGSPTIVNCNGVVAQSNAGSGSNGTGASHSGKK